MIKSGKIFYGWVVVAVSLVIMTMTYGLYFSWPVFYPVIVKEFGWSRAGTAVIFSVASWIYAVGSTVSGYLFDRFGPRRLFVVATVFLAIGAVGSSQSNEIWQFCIFFGFFVGLGAISCGFVPHSALVSNWFVRRRAAAVGISQMGTRDSFLLMPLITLSIIGLGWRPSYLILAAAVVIINIPLALLLRSRPEDMGLLPDGDVPGGKEADKADKPARNMVVNEAWAATEWTFSRAARTFQFWACAVVMLGAGLTFTSLLNHFVALVTDVGYTPMFAASLLLFYAIAAMTGRASGFISDYLGRELTFSIAMGFMLLALPLLLLTRDASTAWMLYAFVICFGFGSGLYTPAFVAGMADLFQGPRFGVIIGTANMGYAIGAAIGTWGFGLIFDITASYDLAIHIVVVAVVVKLLAMWLAAPRRVRRVPGFGRQRA